MYVCVYIYIYYISANVAESLRIARTSNKPESSESLSIGTKPLIARMSRQGVSIGKAKFYSEIF